MADSEEGDHPKADAQGNVSTGTASSAGTKSGGKSDGKVGSSERQGRSPRPRTTTASGQNEKRGSKRSTSSRNTEGGSTRRTKAQTGPHKKLNSNPYDEKLSEEDIKDQTRDGHYSFLPAALLRLLFEFASWVSDQERIILRCNHCGGLSHTEKSCRFTSCKKI